MFAEQRTQRKTYNRDYSGNSLIALSQGNNLWNSEDLEETKVQNNLNDIQGHSPMP